MKITKFNKNNLPRLRAAMNSALKEVGEKFGITVEVGSASYRPHETTFRVKLSMLNEDGDSLQGHNDFVSYAPMYGFDENDFGRVFTTEKGDFRIIGWNRRRHRYPVEAIQVSSGKPYIFTPRTVLHALGKPGRIISRR